MPRSTESRVVALIPARSGSQRVKHKNIRPLAGHPLIAYTIAAAVESRIFADVVVSTDSETYARIARHYGADVPFLRAAEIADSTSPDIEWILHALETLRAAGRSYDAFAILRPTSPFRKPETIARAWQTFIGAKGVDSLRAVERVEQHPGKMWVVRNNRMLPLMPLSPEDKPSHSQQKAALPEIFVQNASLEIAWTEMALRTRSIAGSVLVPFFTEGDEGIDINAPQDWWYAEYLIGHGEALLPRVDRPPFEDPLAHAGEHPL
jgi:CMP-N,N'-diacetyllegionaminic acid synthase